MFRAIGFLIKISLFSLLVLILGNWIRWNGVTISDQIKFQMAHAEKSAVWMNITQWSENMVHDARDGFKKKPQLRSTELEDHPSSERRKLKALIQELNTN